MESENSTFSAIGPHIIPMEKIRMVCLNGAIFSIETADISRPELPWLVGKGNRRMVFRSFLNWAFSAREEA
jgi:hypothetical protein